MIKKSIEFSIIFFVILTIWQWLFRLEIHWLDNVGLSFTVFLCYVFFEWVQKPHEYKKDKR